MLFSIRFRQLFTILLSILVIAKCEDITFCYKGRQCYELNDKTFKEKWKNELQIKLNDVSVMKIHDLKLSEKNFVTLLSHKLPKLQRLILWNHDEKNPRRQTMINNLATPKMIEAIFTSNYFEQLIELDLTYTNIQFRHFQFLKSINRTLNSKIQELQLTGNYLEQRAFKLLEKINFNGKIQTLGLSQNSLISKESIESILVMIKSPDGSKSNLKNLTLYNTGITTDNVVRLLENIETSKMTNLNIALNSLQHSKSFNIPFNNTIYEYLSKCNFSSLKRINLNDLDLDDQQLPFLRQMKLPSLETLEMGQNFITDEYFRQWITIQNMPKLQRLGLKTEENSIGDQAIKLLVEQNFPNLSELYLFNNRKLTPKHLEYLSAVNSSKWTHLELSHNSMFQVTLRKFFQGKSFDNLEQLTMLSSDDCFRLFEFLPWESMKKLQILQILDSDFSWSVKHIVESNMTFPSLKHWNFGGPWLTKEYLNSLVRNLTHFGPQLQVVDVMTSMINQHTAYVNISELNMDTLPLGLYLRVADYMTLYKPYDGAKAEIADLTFDEGNSNFFSAMFHYSFFDGYESTDIDYTKKLLYDSHQLSMVCDFLLERVTIQKIESINFYTFSDFLFIKKLFFKEDKKKYDFEAKRYFEDGIDYKPTVYMPYLRSINYIPANKNLQEAQFYYYLNKIQMPLLNAVIIGNQNNKMLIKFTQKLISRTPNLHTLYLMGSKIDCVKLQELFVNLTLPFLRKLTLSSNQLEKECLVDIIARHPLVRNLDLSNNFLQKGLFDEVVGKNELILSTFGFSNIQIGNEQFAKISNISREFIMQVSAPTIDIDTQGILWLVGNMTTGWLFPKCQQINFGSNNINETGVLALLQTGLPFLKQLHLLYNTNPNLINNMLSYPNKYLVINIKDQNVFGLSKEIDRRSTRHVQMMGLQSSALLLEDYQILSRLDFSKLFSISLVIENLYECEFLQYILRIIQDTDSMYLKIKSEKLKKKSLIDSCLSKNPPTEIYMRHLRDINVQWYGVYSYIPNFYTYMYSKHRLVETLAIANGLIGDDNLLSIVKNSNLEHLWLAVLVNNLLTDRSIGEFFKGEMVLLKEVELANNLITSEGLKSLVGVSFTSLMRLGLEYNQIDDKGIEYLTEAEFPQLQVLALTGNDITRSGFLKLFDLKAPKLLAIDIQQTLMTEEDLLWVFQQLSLETFNNLPFLVVIDTRIRLNKINQQRIDKIVKQKLNRPSFVIYYDEYYLKTINKADIKFNRE